MYVKADKQLQIRLVIRKNVAYTYLLLIFRKWFGSSKVFQAPTYTNPPPSN
jgi:hypothetical protein